MLWIGLKEKVILAIGITKGQNMECASMLRNLKSLLMDDNFLFHDHGLPPQFKQLKNLEKLRLSYNVFEGELETAGGGPVLAGMTKMTHLEMESNYFNGTFPADSLAEMPNLTYLYMRRNDMKFNLDFIKRDTFAKALPIENLFAMWLDGNFVTGTIPTEIGLMSGLNSLSLANGTLTGTIPEEIGNLNQLKRLWLFNNKLTGNIPQALGNLGVLEVGEFHGNKLGGDMPQGLCSTVASAEYEHKSLTSDCKKLVKCDEASCCTKCY